jgi:hypothetical protein
VCSLREALGRIQTSAPSGRGKADEIDDCVDAALARHAFEPSLPRHRVRAEHGGPTGDLDLQAHRQQLSLQSK